MHQSAGKPDFKHFSVVSGNSPSRSTYDINSNISIAINQSLTFRNTSIEVTGNRPIWIFDSGSLAFINSSIRPLNSSLDFLNIVAVGNESVHPVLTFTGASFLISGSINSVNSSVKILNSTLNRTGRGNTPQDSLRLDLTHSYLFMQNSSLDGLYSTSGIKNRIGASFSYNSTTPFSRDADIPLSENAFLPHSAVADELNVTLEYSGDNPGENGLIFNLGTNRIGSFAFGSTGSVYTDRNATFSFNVTSLGANISEFLSGLSVKMNVSYAVGSNSSVIRMECALSSGDIVDIIGADYFDYIFSGTDAIIGNSVLGLNSVPLYLSPNRPDPERNSIVLKNGSSLFFTSSSIASGKGSAIPFITEGQSRFYMLQEVTLNPLSHLTDITNYSYVVSPANLNSSLNYDDHSILDKFTQLTQNFTHFPRTYMSRFLDRGLLLPEYAFNATYACSLSDYNIVLDGNSLNFTLEPFPYYSTKAYTLGINLDLPDITAEITTFHLFTQTNNTLDTAIHCTLADSGQINWTLDYYTSVPVNIASGNFKNLGKGLWYNITSALYLKNVNFSHPLTVLLSLYVPNYTVSGHYINISRNVSIYPSVFLNVSSSYSWVSVQNLQLNISIVNAGKQDLNNSLLTIHYFSGSILETGKSVSFSISGRSVLSEIVDSANASNTSRIEISVLPSISLFRNSTLSLNLTVLPDPLYNVTFHENGLPAGKKWAVTVGGKMLASSGENITFILPDGDYSFSLEVVAGYTNHAETDQFTVASSDTEINVNFSVTVYEVEIIETGLSANATWYVSLSTGNYAFHTSDGIIMLSNGSYTLSYSTAGHYSGGIANITVEGHAGTVKVTFVNTEIPVTGRIIQFLYENRYFILVGAALAAFYAFRRYRYSVKICSKCFTTYKGFGRCPVCKSGGKINESTESEQGSLHRPGRYDKP